MSKIKLYSNFIMRAPPCIFLVSGTENKVILKCNFIESYKHCHVYDASLNE